MSSPQSFFCLGIVLLKTTSKTNLSDFLLCKILFGSVLQKAGPAFNLASTSTCLGSADRCSDSPKDQLCEGNLTLLLWTVSQKLWRAALCCAAAVNCISLCRLVCASERTKPREAELVHSGAVKAVCSTEQPSLC